MLLKDCNYCTVLCNSHFSVINIMKIFYRETPHILQQLIELFY